LERTVDFAAIARVAKKAELKSVRMIEISARCETAVLGTTLVPAVNLECKPGALSKGTFEVLCEYEFSARIDKVQVVESKITYLLAYEISGTEDPSPEDLAEFARANGTLNSWPFVREVLFGLTSRMGYPPYTLPLMHFNTKAAPKRTPKPSSEEAPVVE
jgi:preprotein translocase subunit SecB